MKFRKVLCLILGFVWMGLGSAEAADKTAKTVKAGEAGEKTEWVAAREAIDGDTLILEDGKRVRLIGIDTPEIKDEYGRNARTAQRTRATKKMVQHYALEARAAASQWVKGQKLKLIYDPSNKDTKNLDDYGRTLAYVCRESDDSCLAEHLLEDGYALVYRRFAFKRKKNFIRLEDRARISQKHLWQNQPPAKESKRTR